MLTENLLLTDWVNTYTNDLYSWALHKVSNSELAKDLVQDTFLAASEKMVSFKAESTPKTWLFSILNHKIIDVYRKKVNQPVHLDNQIFSKYFDEEGSWKTEEKPREWHEDETHLLDDIDFVAVLQKCLDALPENWSTSVKLKYLLNKKGEEICQELGIAPTNFWQIIHRAKLQLRDFIEKSWFKN
ncbi:MAG: RNA polymerase subunit sigma [Bacteroidetes bacterium]|nr:MAG: RNA polymerase subunit sigma [Bacteroidota bacterium]